MQWWHSGSHCGFLGHSQPMLVHIAHTITSSQPRNCDFPELLLFRSTCTLRKNIPAHFCCITWLTQDAARYQHRVTPQRVRAAYRQILSSTRFDGAALLSHLHLESVLNGVNDNTRLCCLFSSISLATLGPSGSTDLFRAIRSRRSALGCGWNRGRGCGNQSSNFPQPRRTSPRLLFDDAFAFQSWGNVPNMAAKTAEGNIVEHQDT
jgi:hypothetical protein